MRPWSPSPFLDGRKGTMAVCGFRDENEASMSSESTPTRHLTRREILGLIRRCWLGRPRRPNRVAPGQQAPSATFPRGAVVRTVLKDMPPDGLGSGATLFHEHLSLTSPYPYMPRPATPAAASPHEVESCWRATSSTGTFARWPRCISRGCRHPCSLRRITRIRSCRRVTECGCHGRPDGVEQH